MANAVDMQTELAYGGDMNTIETVTIACQTRYHTDCPVSTHVDGERCACHCHIPVVLTSPGYGRFVSHFAVGGSS